MEEKGEGFVGTIIKDTWTITRGSGNRGRRWGGLGLWGEVGGRQKTILEQLKKEIKKVIVSKNSGM